MHRKIKIYIVTALILCALTAYQNDDFKKYVENEKEYIARMNEESRVYFPHAVSSSYWTSSTSFWGWANFRWYVSFDNGLTNFMDEATTNYVRCVANPLPPVESVYYPIIDTGQNESYTGVWGEDSDYQDVPAIRSFTDNGDGTVTDNVTGLLWSKCSMVAGNKIDVSLDCSGQPAKYTWADAGIACSSVSLAGRSWRLPTVAELSTLVHFGRKQPAIH